MGDDPEDACAGVVRGGMLQAGGCYTLKGAAKDEKRRVERCLPRASPESSVSRNQTKPTWSRGPDALFLRSTPPRGLSPPRAPPPPPSTSMPCVLAEMPAPRRALATTREGAAAAPLMEREDEPGFGLLAIAESAWYAAMGGGEVGGGGSGRGGSGKGRSEETNAGGNACLRDSQL